MKKKSDFEILFHVKSSKTYAKILYVYFWTGVFLRNSL